MPRSHQGRSPLPPHGLPAPSPDASMALAMHRGPWGCWDLRGRCRGMTWLTGWPRTSGFARWAGGRWVGAASTAPGASRWCRPGHRRPSPGLRRSRGAVCSPRPTPSKLWPCWRLRPRAWRPWRGPRRAPTFACRCPSPWGLPATRPCWCFLGSNWRDQPPVMLQAPGAGWGPPWPRCIAAALSAPARRGIGPAVSAGPATMPSVPAPR